MPGRPASSPRSTARCSGHGLTAGAGRPAQPSGSSTVDKLFDDHPRLRAAWGPGTARPLRDDEQGALAALDRFADLYATGELPEFSSVVDTVIAWSTEILGGTTPADLRTAESKVPTTSSVLRRTAHGFTNPANFAARGILTT